MRNLGTLADYLAECGYVVDGDNLTQQAEMLGFEKRELQLA